MAQFDFLLIFPILWSTVISLLLNYWFLIDYLLPNFSGLLKFRKKILNPTKLNVLLIKKISI